MKWDLNEWKNQGLHFIAGIITTGAFSFVFKIYDWRLLLVGLTVGIGVEIYQYFFRDKWEAHLWDRIRDVVFYDIGSLVIWNFFLILYLK